MFNLMKTAILMAAITALFMAIGSLLGGQQRHDAGAGRRAGHELLQLLVLRQAGAEDVQRAARSTTSIGAAVLRAWCASWRSAPSCRCRSVYLIDEDAPNAFATGRNPQHAAVAATTGILRVLERARAARRDGARAGAREAPRHPDHHRSARRWPARSRCWPTSRCSSAAATATAARPTRSSASLVMILAPLAASLIQMAISRAREFEADRGGAEISGDPQALASALQKIQRLRAGHRRWRRPSATPRRRR